VRAADDEASVNNLHLHDGSLTLEFPFKMAVAVETTPHPLLTTEHPLVIKRRILLPDNLTHTVEARYFPREEAGTKTGSASERLDLRVRVGKSSASRAAPLRHLEPPTDGITHLSSDYPPHLGYEGKVLTVCFYNVLIC